MEFPELGKHCASPTCSRLDFLPFECNACHQIFCKDHGPYDKHDCQFSYAKDARVPVCPLCNQPVPVNRGEDPNIKVNMHIQNECKSEKSKNITNRCSVPGCKKKELVPVTCNTCRKNFCLKHRFETDHSCQGHPDKLRSSASGRSPTASKGRMAGRAGGSVGRPSGAPQKTTMSQIGAELNRERMMRQQNRGLNSSTQQPIPTQLASDIQSKHMAEDEAMALAMAVSLAEATPNSSSTNPSSSAGASPPSHPHTAHSSQQQSITTPPPKSTMEEDEALARAIAASLNDEGTPRPKPKSSFESRRQDKKSSGTDSCTIS